MKQPHFYIRHAIGSRLLLDSIQHNIPYVVEPYADKWRFTMEVNHVDIVQEIIQCKSEINLFITKEDEGDGIQKWWYYDRHDPVIQFDRANKVLTIIVDSKKGYTV